MTGVSVGLTARPFFKPRVLSGFRSSPDVPVNANVSAWQLRLTEFKDDYLSVLETHGVEPRRIVPVGVEELTETHGADAKREVA